MDKDLVSLQIDPQIVLGVIEKQIQAAIVHLLGGQEELIGNAVTVALSQKVSHNGKISQYSSDNKHDYLELLAEQSIREAAKEALKEWLKDNAGKVKDAVLKELKKPARQNSIARAYADAIEHSLKCSWDMHCNISFKEVND